MTEYFFCPSTYKWQEHFSSFTLVSSNVSYQTSCHYVTTKLLRSQGQSNGWNCSVSLQKKWTKYLKMNWNKVKFRFSKKATKFETISNMIWRLISSCQIKWEIVSKFCGLFWTLFIMTKLSRKSYKIKKR